MAPRPSWRRQDEADGAARDWAGLSSETKKAVYDDDDVNGRT